MRVYFFVYIFYFSTNNFKKMWASANCWRKQCACAGSTQLFELFRFVYFLLTHFQAPRSGAPYWVPCLSGARFTGSRRGVAIWDVFEQISENILRERVRASCGTFFQTAPSSRGHLFPESTFFQTAPSSRNHLLNVISTGCGNEIAAKCWEVQLAPLRGAPATPWRVHVDCFRILMSALCKDILRCSRDP